MKKKQKNIRVWNKTRKKASFTRATRREKIKQAIIKKVEELG